jgi:hypothetical protein
VGKFLRTIVVGTSDATSATEISPLTSVISAVADTTAPTVTGVTSTNGTYKAGDVITIVVAMSEAVMVTGTPTLALDTTPTSRNATYVSGSGTNSLTFTYTVQASDTASDLNYAATSSLSGRKLHRMSQLSAPSTKRVCQRESQSIFHPLLRVFFATS